MMSRGVKRIVSYLLTGITATGDDGHTAHFHDCCDMLSVQIKRQGQRP
jgi:hypothetical protein